MAQTSGKTETRRLPLMDREKAAKHGFRIIGNIIGGLIGKLVVTAILAVIAYTGLARLTNLPIPFGHHESGISESAVLTRLTKIKEFHAATASFSVQVKITHKLSFIPCFIWCDTLEMKGRGSDDAIVSFASLSGKDLTIAGTAVSVILPAPYIAPANLDLAKCYVSSSQGIINTVGRVFHNNPDAAKPLYLMAESEIHADAVQSNLILEGEHNTRDLLTGLLRRLGYHQVAVNFR